MQTLNCSFFYSCCLFFYLKRKRQNTGTNCSLGDNVNQGVS